MNNARLEVNDGLGQRVVPLTKDLLAIGRRTESDLRLVGSDVSRKHAEIVRQGEGWILKDKGSRYGTYVNGEAVTEHTLVHGDRVQFGRASGTDIVFLTGDIVYTRGRISEYRPKHFGVYNTEETPLLRQTLFIGAPGNHDTAGHLFLSGFDTINECSNFANGINFALIIW